MPIFQVNLEKCRRDGICNKVCPMLIIREDADGVPFLVPGGAETCIGCGQCVAFCPYGAASLEGLPMERAEKIDRSLLPSPEAVAQLMKTRRSVRVFSKKTVPYEVLERIISMANYAPSAENSRQVRWIIVEEADTVTKIISLTADFLDEAAGPKPVTPEQRSLKMLAMHARKGKDLILRGARQLAVAVAQNDVWGHNDAAIALTYFELAAHSLGVGCCWAGYFTAACEHSQALRALLGLTENESVYGGQMFGYPGLRPTYLPPRIDARVDWM